MTNQYKFFRFWLLLLFLHSMYPWFFWQVPSGIMSAIGSILALGVLKSKKKSEKKSVILVFVPIVLLYLWIGRRFTFLGNTNSLLDLFIIYTCLKLNDDYKLDIIRFITKSFAILLGFSLFFFCLHIIGIPLPHYIIEFPEYGNFDNYIFFIVKNDGIRFQSVFLEPGHMTMGLAPLLVINKYDIKNRAVIVLLLAQFFSMSLAGYITLALGYIMCLFYKNFVSGLKYLISFVVIVTVFVLFTVEYLGSDVLTTRIIERLVFEDGKLVGDNRSTIEFTSYYEQIMSSSDKWLGVYLDNEYWTNISGFKKYVVSNGLVGLIICLIAYTMPFLHSFKKAFPLYAILLLLLYQNAYVNWWCMIIPITLGVTFICRQDDAHEFESILSPQK